MKETVSFAERALLQDREAAGSRGVKDRPAISHGPGVGGVHRPAYLHTYPFAARCIATHRRGMRVAHPERERSRLRAGFLDVG